MSVTSYRGQHNPSSALQKMHLRRGMVFGLILITALLAFELFNYSTTDFALSDLLGELSFLGLRWATILSIAFCGIDFAGIARLFTPEGAEGSIKEVWYLFGAWMLAAVMNAMLTWWGVSIAILNHETLGNAVVERATLLRVVPIFVAVLVWLIRVLIIGTFSVAGECLFDLSYQHGGTQNRHTRRLSGEQSNASPPRPRSIHPFPASQTQNPRVAQPVKTSRKPRPVAPSSASLAPKTEFSVPESRFKPAPKPEPEPASPQEPEYTPNEYGYHPTTQSSPPARRSAGINTTPPSWPSKSSRQSR